VLGQRIADARERAGLSQLELAERLGVKQPTVAYWERKAEKIRSDVCTRIAQALNVSTDELLGRKTPATKTAQPIGKTRQLFEAISRLPRRQQEKIISILEPFVREHVNGKTG
jgi:transcriptional regulator with XRE-family HTH domain